MALSKIGKNGVTHWRSKREDDFLFSLFYFFLLNLRQELECIYYVRLKK